jgi:hypothetical protein
MGGCLFIRWPLLGNKHAYTLQYAGIYVNILTLYAISLSCDLLQIVSGTFHYLRSPRNCLDHEAGI